MDSPDIVEISSRKKSRTKSKRRFTDEQVQLLESMFETETKLEPRRKAQVAIELGLQPRQVAIWFQNKRARWRSKHIEKEFAILHSDYEDLKCRYERLKNEKQSLLIELQMLRDREKGKQFLAGNSSDDSSKKGDKNCAHEPRPCRLDEEDKGQKVDGSSASPERRRKVDECGFSYQPCSDCDSTKWWEFWN